MDSYEWSRETDSLAATQALGALLARRLQPGDTLALLGELGSGKTAFAQGVARGLGVSAPVTSPTFTLINEYRAAAGLRLQHIDCYRLSHASAEMWDVGLADLLAGDDVVLIEWADRIRDLLPDDRLEIQFEWLDENRRSLRFTGQGPRHSVLLQALATGQIEKAA